MPDEPRRIVIEKSSTVRRRYQRSNKQFRFTAAELKRIEREEELDRRAKSIREKEKKRVANKKKKDEQERERKRLGLPDPNVRKVSSSQPLLSNFLGLARNPAPVPEPQPAQDITGSGLESGAGDTEEDSDGPDDLDEELENELSCLQEALVSENFDGHDAVLGEGDHDAELEKDPPCLQETAVPEELDNHAARDERSGSGGLCLEKTVVPDEADGLGVNFGMDQADEDTDPFDDLDEELERELYCLQDAGILEQETLDQNTNDKSNETLALCFDDRDDDEFSDCSAFDDEDILKAAEAVIKSPSIQPGPSDHISSKPAVIVHASSDECIKPVMNAMSSASDSFRDDTADWMEEVFERGCGESFCDIYE
jgi:hypothetical protein